MKKTSGLVLLLCWLAGYSPASGGPVISNPYTSYAVSIAIGSNGGSGFFLQASNSVYLVTARHILFADGKGSMNLRGPEALCSYYPSGSETSSTVTLKLNVLLDQQEIRYSTNHDLALVRFEECSKTNKDLVTYQRDAVRFSDVSKNSFQPVQQASEIKKYGEISVGAEAYLVSFPTSLGLKGIDIPLLKKGMVAGKDTHGRKLVLDCPSYPGNVGGPVITMDELNPSVTAFLVLGVVVETVQSHQVWQNPQLGLVKEEVANSGYSIAESMDTVLEMVWK